MSTNIQPDDPTFGPLFDYALDADRINKQLGRIERLMRDGIWRTVDEISQQLENKYCEKFPAPSVSSDLRHLRKPQFGSYNVCTRRRTVGLVEYLLHESICICQWCAWERERKEKRGRKAA